MAKLYFKYGAMKSGKTLDLIRTHDSYTKSGRKVAVITPSLDDRFGKNLVKSRVGLEVKAYPIEVGTIATHGLYDEMYDVDIILVDEAQFFTKEDIDYLKIMTLHSDIPVIAYGLKTTFQGVLFEGSKRLLEVAEDISEIKSVCHYCKDKATHNLRLVNGAPTYMGDVVLLGDEDYIPVCHYHYQNPK